MLNRDCKFASQSLKDPFTTYYNCNEIDRTPKQSKLVASSIYRPDPGDSPLPLFGYVQ